MDHLLSSAPFQGMPQWQLLLVSALAIAVLGKAADWLVEAASALALRLGVSKVIIGATIVSLGTTSPECAVSVVAAWSGQPGLALGNAIGSIIADTGLIFGLGCLMATLPADRFVLTRQGWVQFGSAVLLAGACYAAWWFAGETAQLGRPVGVAFLLLLVLYLMVSVRWSRQHPVGDTLPDGEARRREPTVRLVLVILGSLALVLLASRVLILSVTELAENHWMVPKIVIAATLVAFGTSLPELVIGLTSVMKGHGEILVGNVVGADVLNVLFVIGASAVAAPLPVLEHGTPVPGIALVLHLPAMLLVLLLFRVFIFGAARRGSFRRWQGVPLIAIYVVYVIAQFLVTRPAS